MLILLEGGDMAMGCGADGEREFATPECYTASWIRRLG